MPCTISGKYLPRARRLHSRLRNLREFSRPVHTARALQKCGGAIVAIARLVGAVQFFRAAKENWVARMKRAMTEKGVTFAKAPLRPPNATRGFLLTDVACNSQGNLPCVRDADRLRCSRGAVPPDLAHAQSQGKLPLRRLPCTSSGKFSLAGAAQPDAPMRPAQAGLGPPPLERLRPDRHTAGETHWLAPSRACSAAVQQTP
jgi:hypothetical protein